MSIFEDQVKTLAYQSGLKVAEVNGSRARLLFTFDTDGKETQQTVWIIPFKDGGHWEFSCPTAIKGDPEDMPKMLLIFALKQNSEYLRGFWCLEDFDGTTVLEYMHNISSALLTPSEFNRTCWAVATRVDELERKLF
jgi:hypothetical protein